MNSPLMPITALCAALAVGAAYAQPAPPAPEAGGRTFYVSPRGSDACEGRSPGTAWKTCARVNATRFLPGDQVRFRRGGQWRESLAASSDGAPGRPITYAAYGSGPKPIFWGSDVLANAAFVPQGHDVYTYRTSVTVHSVLVDHAFLVDVQDLPHRQVVRDPADTPECWKYTAGVLTISTRAGDDPRTDGRTYTACTRVDALASAGHRHLAFRDLVADETALYDDGYAVRIMGSVDVLVEDCEAYRGGKHNFGCINSTQVRFVRCLAAYAMPNQDASLYVSYADTDPSGRGAASSRYDDCTADHAEDTSRPGTRFLSFVCHGGQLGPMDFENFTTHGGKFSVLQDREATRQTFRFHGGWIDGADYELIAPGGLTDGARLTGDASVDVYGSGNMLRNLKMDAILPVGGGPTGYRSAIVIRASAQDTVIVSTSVTMALAAGDGAACLTLLRAASRTRWHDSVLLSAGAAVNTPGFTPALGDLVGTDGNVYSASATFGDGRMTLTQWRAATGADMHSRVAVYGRTSMRKASGSPLLP